MEPSEILRPGRRRRFEDAQRTGIEAHDGHAGVLRFDVDEAGRRHAAYRFDVAHEPGEHIHVVRGLVHEHAAIVRPCSSPGFRVVVGLIARPAQADGPQHEPAEAPLLQGFTRLRNRRVVPVLVHDEQFDAVHVARFDHPVRILQPQRQRLLDDERPPVLHQVEDVATVGAAWGEDGDRVDRVAYLAHHRAHAVEGWRPELAGKLLRPGQIAVDEGTNLGFVERADAGRARASWQYCRTRLTQTEPCS